MGLRKVLINFGIILIVVVLLTSCANIGGNVQWYSFFDERYTLNHYFDDWQSEANTSYDTILFGEIHNNGEQLDVHAWENTIYCIYDNRVFFLKNNTYPSCEWSIVSTDFNGDNATIHYTGLFFDETTSNIEREYNNLSIVNSNENQKCYGGYFENGKIYLFGKERSVVFDVASNTFVEGNDAFVPRYRYSTSEDIFEIIITNGEGVSKSVNLYDLAENNQYIKELLELRRQKRWDGSSYLSNPFAYLKSNGEKLIIVLSVFNYHGESFAISFECDFDTLDIEFISYSKVGDIVIPSHYDIVIEER